jgi:hypothetical protein
MPQAKPLSKRKRNSKVAPVLGAAGLLTFASGASAEAFVDRRTPDVGASHHAILVVEQIQDVSLSMFHVIDKENLAAVRPGVRFAVGAGGGCWTGTYYTLSESRNDAYPPRPAKPSRKPALKRVPKN